jgi:bacteriorhodopsin
MLVRVLVGVSVFYPVWWVVAPTGLGWVTEATALLGFAGLDVMSKAGYGMLVVVETKGLAQTEAQTQTD